MYLSVELHLDENNVLKNVNSTSSKKSSLEKQDTYYTLTNFKVGQSHLEMINVLYLYSHLLTKNEF